MVFGASGFTGKYVAKFLHGKLRELKGKTQIKWAVAGISKQKLLNVLQEIENVKDIIADVNDHSLICAHK